MAPQYTVKFMTKIVDFFYSVFQKDVAVTPKKRWTGHTYIEF